MPGELGAFSWSTFYELYLFYWLPDTFSFCSNSVVEYSVPERVQSGVHLHRTEFGAGQVSRSPNSWTFLP